MHQLLNTLYVQTPRSYLHLDHETLKVKLEGEYASRFRCSTWGPSSASAT